MYSRKRSQQERADKNAKRLGKLRAKRGRQILQQHDQEPALNADPEESAVVIENIDDEKHVDPAVPDEWGTSAIEATKGRFAVFEAMYGNNQKGIAVAVVRILCNMQ